MTTKEALLSAAALLLCAAMPAAASAADNLLPPLIPSPAQPGEMVPLPWRTADGRDSGTNSVKLGSPDEGKADWVRLDDNSPTFTVYVALSKLPPLAKGSFSFEILIPGGGSTGVTVALGTEAVTTDYTRQIAWRFSSNGRLGVGSRDIYEDVDGGYEFGVPLAFRCEFDLNARKLAFFAGDKKEPVKEIQLPDELPPVTAVRVTSGQKGTSYWFVRNLVLAGN